jgi:hypothetical protein
MVRFKKLSASPQKLLGEARTSRNRLTGRAGSRSDGPTELALSFVPLSIRCRETEEKSGSSFALTVRHPGGRCMAGWPGDRSLTVLRYRAGNAELAPDCVMPPKVEPWKFVLVRRCSSH